MQVCVSGGLAPMMNMCVCVLADLCFRWLSR